MTRVAIIACVDEAQGIVRPGAEELTEIDKLTTGCPVIRPRFGWWPSSLFRLGRTWITPAADEPLEVSLRAAVGPGVPMTAGGAVFMTGDADMYRAAAPYATDLYLFVHGGSMPDRETMPDEVMVRSWAWECAARVLRSSPFLCAGHAVRVPDRRL